MARAARGAGAETAPNSSLAGGFFGTGALTAAFLAASAGAAGVVAGALGGLTCSAETAPQNSNSKRPKASLCIDDGPASLLRLSAQPYHK